MFTFRRIWLGNTDVDIKLIMFDIVLSGLAVVLRNLSQPVIVGMYFLRDNYLYLNNLNPQFAHLVHAPTNQKSSAGINKGSVSLC